MWGYVMVYSSKTLFSYNFRGKSHSTLIQKSLKAINVYIHVLHVAYCNWTIRSHD